MHLRSYYNTEEALIADLVKYLAINQPAIIKLSATQIVLEEEPVCGIMRQDVIEESAERMTLAVMVVEHYVLATGRCLSEVYWPTLNKSPLRDIAPAIHPLIDE